MTPEPHRPLGSSFSGRKLTVLGLLVTLLLSSWWLGPLHEDLSTGKSDGLLEAALHPGFSDQSRSLPDDATPFMERILGELGSTIRYAIIAMSMAVPTGILLGLAASTSWWPDRGRIRLILRPIYLFTRTFITLMRSIHELIWALLFVSAIGSEPITACVALTLPFGGTLAKVFSEIIDEQHKAAREQLVTSGARPMQAFFASILPQAVPDMTTYTLYRFECALRSSAVLGFIGIETIGLSIKRSFENNFYNELWTELYLLIIVIIAVDLLGSLLRYRLNTIPSRTKALSQSPDIDELKKKAPRWQLTRILGWATILLITLSWFPNLAGIQAEELTKAPIGKSRSERMETFGKRLTPAPVRESGDWADAIPWAQELWTTSGKAALLNTVAMATAAIILSGFAAWIMIPWASRALATAHPLGLFNGKFSWLKSTVWKSTGFLTRSLFIISRAIPEYIYAYLLIGILGISAWPLVIALALHNFGILGRLWGEVMENQPAARAQHVILHGGSRWQSYLASYMPESFNRFLMYLFYRWETCVREATILGMLGVASLGYEIQIARNFSRAYDEMFFFVLLGAAIVFVGDLVSLALRYKLRND
ncbi:ABC transporter permease subunit [Verrucomicrobiaceae bacterium R5-34]|uniref:ABC transporter permease subunit n=1 Tax=Oceaniferula flava TaxID=2800421 RepID=A0AAE2SDQ8_9BACT|nr:ABC transporter permease subunit [Oceaniferula flavus]MBK1829813.1 ABC transporter permease subunit [Verrucomicrobiaceae bacterium R5-34]MBK1856381.1 ABC transporter permease subunit [Oceaniferula flavus]MBM1137688.1 ABC transporter permease subunit [Oceaniferula flavus]